MVRTVVVTDSNTCLPPSVIDGMPVHVLPIMVHLPEAVGEDASQELVEATFRAQAQRRPVSSTPPSALDFLRLCDQVRLDATEPGAGIVVVTPAAEFTSIYDNACSAAALSSNRVVVVDSRTAAAGQALVVLEGARLAREGARVDEVVGAIEAASRGVDLVGALATVAPLRHSGRVALRGVLPGPGRRLFRMKDGDVTALGAAGDLAEAVGLLGGEWKAAGGADLSETVVFHAAAPEAARELEEALGSVSFVTGFSAAMGIYTGPGLVGAAWLP